MSLCLTCVTNNVCVEITRPDGKSAMMVPVNEIPPVSEEIQSQVEEFRKSFVKFLLMRPETREAMEMLFTAKWNLPKAAKHANLTNKEMKITFNEYCVFILQLGSGVWRNR